MEQAAVCEAVVSSERDAPGDSSALPLTTVAGGPACTAEEIESARIHIRLRGILGACCAERAVRAAWASDNGAGKAARA